MLNKKLLISMLVTLNVLGVSSSYSAGVPPEEERFEYFHDPTNPGIVRVPIVRHFPTVEEIETAKKDYQEGELKLLGRPVRTIWGTLIEVDINIPEGLRLLRRAAYYGHPKACSLLLRCFRSGFHGVNRNEMFADALSASARNSETLWEASEHYLKKGKAIPTIDMTADEVWGPIERARKDIAEAETRRKEAEEKRIADATAAIAAEDIHLESKYPEEDVDEAAAGGETDPLLTKGSELRRRHGVSPTH